MASPWQASPLCELTKLVDTRELWFILIANPDGYDFTFTPENRLWRKNLRDNDGERSDHGHRRRGPEPELPDALGATTTRGRTANFASETYHGTGPASEPETKAFRR